MKTFECRLLSDPAEEKKTIIIIKTTKSQSLEIRVQVE